MFDSIEIATTGQNLAALSVGEGPLMLLVHGFPDTPHGFHHQLEYFSGQGFRVVAPWLRGFAPSSPASDGHYTAAALGQDLLNIMDSLEVDQAVVIGHDWGAAAACSAALSAPDRISHLITSAVPYGPALIQELATNGDQQRRSWYLFFFQTPLAQLAVAHNNFEFLRRLWQEWAGPDWGGDNQALDAVVDCFRQPGTISAALELYRQLFSEPPPTHYPLIRTPSLYIHGEQDGCIGIELAAPDAKLFADPCDYAPIAGAGHFVHLEKPNEFNRRVAEFISS